MHNKWEWEWELEYFATHLPHPCRKWMSYITSGYVDKWSEIVEEVLCWIWDFSFKVREWGKCRYEWECTIYEEYISNNK